MAGWPSASFCLSSSSLIFKVCRIMNMMNYSESAAHGWGPGGYIYTWSFLSHKHAQSCSHALLINPAARRLFCTTSDIFGFSISLVVIQVRLGDKTLISLAKDT